MTPPDGTVRENFISNKLNTITELEKKISLYMLSMQGHLKTGNII